jgi:hypothetical protein
MLEFSLGNAYQRNISLKKIDKRLKVISEFREAVYAEAEFIERTISAISPGYRIYMNPDPLYRTDVINAAMGARRLTNPIVAKMAGVSCMSVSRIRNGNPNVMYVTLKKVVETVGLTMADISTTKRGIDSIQS